VSGQFPSPWVENIYLISRLVNGEALRAPHVDNAGHCANCRHRWPCPLYGIAEQVVELQQRRAAQ
jgi:hypothetical protein